MASFGQLRNPKKTTFRIQTDPLPIQDDDVTVIVDELVALDEAVCNVTDRAKRTNA